MPAAYTILDEDAVVNILRNRGYGREQRRAFAVAFNVGTGTRYESGSEKRKFSFGLTNEQWQNILRYSENEEDAANRAERAGLGKDAPVAPHVNLAEFQQQPGLTMEVADKLVTNRVAAELGRAMPGIVGPLQDAMGKMMQRMEELAAKLEGTATLANALATKGKPGRKPKPKPEDTTAP